MSISRIYCPFCAAPVTTQRVEDRDRRYCPDCDRVLYRNPNPCAGVLVVEGSGVLLIQRTEPPGVGTWSVPAGYLEWDEPPQAAAVRELAEETGLETASEDICLLDTMFVEHPDSRYVLVMIYAVPREKTSGTLTAGSDAGATRFWNIEELHQADESVEPGYESIIWQGIELQLTTLGPANDPQKEDGNIDRGRDPS